MGLSLQVSSEALLRALGSHRWLGAKEGYGLEGVSPNGCLVSALTRPSPLCSPVTHRHWPLSKGPGQINLSCQSKPILVKLHCFVLLTHTGTYEAS
jgi:hypothetical protein